MGKFTQILVGILFATMIFAAGFSLFSYHFRLKDVQHRNDIFNSNEKVFLYTQDFIDKSEKGEYSTKQLEIAIKQQFGKQLSSLSIVEIKDNPILPNGVDVYTRQQQDYPYHVRYTYCFYCFDNFQPKIYWNILGGLKKPKQYKINNSWILNYE